MNNSILPRHIIELYRESSGDLAIYRHRCDKTTLIGRVLCCTFAKHLDWQYFYGNLRRVVTSAESTL